MTIGERIMQPLPFILYLSLLLFLFNNTTYAQAADKIIKGNAGSTLLAQSFETFNEPWAMTFLPDGDLLVTEKNGTLLMVHLDDPSKVSVKGIPSVAYGGQGGLGDIILHPCYKDTHWIYLSYAEQDGSGKRGAVVARGEQYSGIPIPDHDTRPEFNAPELYWVPTVAPSGLIIYNGSMFPKWQNNAFIGGLRSKSLIRISIKGNQAYEAERFDMGNRIREVEQGPKGGIWVLEDEMYGRLLRLTPSYQATE